MSNGYSVESMLDRIETHVLRIEAKTDIAIKDIANIRADGCSVGREHGKDIGELQSWRDRGIVGIIATLLMSLGALLGMAFGHK